MRWLPCESWEIESPLSVPELVTEMTKRIEPSKWFLLPQNRSHAPLHGSIHSGGFAVSRVIRYRNSFLVALYGTFVPHQNGTTIRVRTLVHPLVRVFMAVYFGNVGMFGLFALVLEHNRMGCFFLGISGIITIAGIGFVYGIFWAEAGKSRRVLSTVLTDIHKEAANGQRQSGGAPRQCTEADTPTVQRRQ
jgi:hypothetical protein